MYENTWKCGELKLYFFHPLENIKKKKEQRKKIDWILVAEVRIELLVLVGQFFLFFPVLAFIWSSTVDSRWLYTAGREGSKRCTSLLGFP